MGSNLCSHSGSQTEPEGSLQWAHLLIAACPHTKLEERLTVKRAMAMGKVPIKANASAKGLQERRKAPKPARAQRRRLGGGDVVMSMLKIKM